MRRYSRAARRITVTLPSHFRHIAVTLPLHHRHITVVLPLRYRCVAVTVPLRYRCVTVTVPLRYRCVAVTVPLRYRCVTVADSLEPIVGLFSAIAHKYPSEFLEFMSLMPLDQEKQALRGNGHGDVTVLHPTAT